jgi:hypothetical protein
VKALKSKPRLKRKLVAAGPAISERQQQIDRSLRAIQKSMAELLFRPLTRGEGMQRKGPDGRRTAELAAEFIKPNDRLSSFERLEIYNQQYWWRLLGAFQDDFQGLRAVLGLRRFDRLAVAYLETYGSRSWSLRDLSEHLVCFLEERPEFTEPKTALALDMVRLEWAKVIAFDGPELPVLDPQRIARTPPERLKLRLQPFITLLELRHPVDHMLKKLRERNRSTASNAMTGAQESAPRPLHAKPSGEPIHLAVHRRQFSVYYKRLEPEAYRLLAALRDGSTLADACAHAFENSEIAEETAAEKIRDWFQGWMQFGWLTR